LCSATTAGLRAQIAIARCRHKPPLPALGTCYTPAEQNDKNDTRFGLTKGEVYEIVLFHAERHSSASHFYLTLSGFCAGARSARPICGERHGGGRVRFCDDGTKNADNVSGVCNTNVQRAGVLRRPKSCRPARCVTRA